MKEISITEAAQELSSQLESPLSRLALAADSNLSTYHLEDDAKKLAGKLKSFAGQLGNSKLYTDISGSKIYNPERDLSDNLFATYAKLCKSCGEALEVRKEEERNYALVSKGIFVCLEDLPEETLPVFKVKIEGNQLIAVRADMVTKLSSEMRKLLGKGDD